MTNFPYCLFPTQVICLTNDEAFLNELHFHSPQHTNTWHLITEPQAALNFLNSSSKSKILFDRVLESREPFLDYNSAGYLYEEIYNLDRFQTISCVLIDEQVQGLSGLDICRQITDPNIQKIFLNSTLEAETVINAFNHGWINYCLPRKNSNFRDHLQQVIKQAVYKYFEKATEKHMESLLKQWFLDSQEISALKEPCFKDYLSSLLKRHNIQEYYPLDLMGSFLLLDIHGQVSALLAFTDNSLAHHMQDARSALEKELDLWERLSPNLLPSSFCIPALYHPIFYDLEPFVVPVYSQSFGHQHYNLALVSQIGNLTPSLRDLEVLHLQERNQE